MEHRIEIVAVKHKYAAAYLGERMGEFRVPECDAARWLLANGKATRDDVLVSCRDGRPALTGTVGWLADHTVAENDRSSPRWTKWRPFAMAPADGPATLCGSAQEPHQAVWDMFGPWVTEMVGQRRSIVVAMDWTDFDADDQTTLALNLVTNHGRATPLLWLTVFKGELKAKRNDYEDLCLLRLAEALPEGAVVTILADRGFGDVKLFAFLDELGFDYVIRFRGNIHVAAADGETR